MTVSDTKQTLKIHAFFRELLKKMTLTAEKGCKGKDLLFFGIFETCWKFKKLKNLLEFRF